MSDTLIPHISLDSAKDIPPSDSVDISDNGIAIFNTIKDLPIDYTPTKVEAAVMVVVLKGCAHLSINMQDYEVQEHSLILLMPNQIVQVIKRSDDFAGVYLALSTKVVNDVTLGVQSNLNVFLYAQSHPISPISEVQEALLMEYHAFIWKQIKKRDNVYRKRIDNYLVLSLVLEIMNIVNEQRPQRTTQKTRKEEQFERFLKLVGEEFREHRTVAHYAERLCITPKYLSALSKSLTGITAGDWIDRCVIQEAKALLKNSTYTIQEVAGMMNFPNQSFFGKYFKSHVGCSPKEYRAK